MSGGPAIVELQQADKRRYGRKVQQTLVQGIRDGGGCCVEGGGGGRSAPNLDGARSVHSTSNVAVGAFCTGLHLRTCCAMPAACERSLRRISTLARRSKQQSPRFTITTLCTSVACSSSTSHHGLFCVSVCVQELSLKMGLRFPSTALEAAPPASLVDDWAVGRPRARLPPSESTVLAWCSQNT